MSLSHWHNTKDWWRAPVLQGPENDYGEYDYLIEPIPDNDKRWERYKRRCDSCGKYHKLNCVYTGYFRTLDGYDSMTDTECWKCYLKDLIYVKIRKTKRKIRNKTGEAKFVREYKKALRKSGAGKLTKKAEKIVRDIYKNRDNY